MNLDITLDHSGVSKSLGAFSNQVPFIVKSVINDLLVAVQTEEVNEIGRDMIVRRTGFPKRNLPITFATKTSLTGTLMVKAPGGGTSVFAKHIEGGLLTGNGGRRAIPSRFIKPNERTILSAAKRPRNLKDSFISRDGKEILVRVGTKKNPKVEVAFNLRNAVMIKPSWDFHGRATETVNKQAQGFMDKRIAQALKTAQLK